MSCTPTGDTTEGNRLANDGPAVDEGVGMLFEALEEEERRNQEWIVEREISKLPAYKAFMPWTRGSDDDKRAAFAEAHALIRKRLMAFLTLAPEKWSDREALKQALDRIGFIESEDGEHV